MDFIKDDIIEPIMPLLNNGTYKFTADGRLEAEFRQHHETPWIHIRQGTYRNCTLWNHVWFACYNIVPSGCQKCWKVVLRPKTLKELLHVYEVLKNLNMPSKCGIEKRYSVNALYGAYMYNDSKEEGLSCLENIRAMLPGIPAFLKRGCTEIEHKLGDSRNWKMTAEQLVLERRLDDLFIDTPQKHIQSEELKKHIMANWVRFAFANGDPTVKELTGEPLYPAYVTFERE